MHAGARQFVQHQTKKAKGLRARARQDRAQLDAARLLLALRRHRGAYRPDADIDHIRVGHPLRLVGQQRRIPLRHGLGRKRLIRVHEVHKAGHMDSVEKALEALHITVRDIAPAPGREVCLPLRGRSHPSQPDATILFDLMRGDVGPGRGAPMQARLASGMAPRVQRLGAGQRSRV